ncbi:MAG: AhpC/TSA family protein [Hymenobacteraceae bacterium]|nr:AhpC/TSA family protein [Hymenobacteraceae bacterium]MDX5394919.1 AhpC/TSA family protein [Hymenobacteraceae bacterium]MDX5510954.1 AhpC/TSA family protein [Hymenobacteraceae bacterium]
MKKLFIAAASLSLMAASCKDQNTKSATADENGYVVSGKINNMSGGKVFLDELGQGQFVSKDTAVIQQDGTFKLQGSVDQPKIYKLGFENRQDMILFVLDNKNIEFEADANNLSQTYQVKGSKDSEVLKELNQLQIANSEKINKLNEQYMMAQQVGQEDSVKAIQNRFMASQEQIQQDLKSFVRQNPNSVVSAFTTAYLIDPESNFAFADSMATVFQKTLPESDYTKALATKVQKMRGASVGQTAPDIKLPNPEGKELALSDYRGKYVLVDFWASWCGPCRKENPNVVRMYNKYKDKGFEIFGVSLDQNKDKWVQAIANDKLTWPHVSDLQGWQSSAAQLYNVTSIPQTVLVDKEGKIIAKGLRGEALEQKLASLLK